MDSLSFFVDIEDVHFNFNMKIERRYLMGGWILKKFLIFSLEGMYGC